MEIWRTGYGNAKRPEVLGTRNLSIALALHVGCFVLFWLYAVLHGLFVPKEEIIPIDLTVVVNENLDGEENEPPPLREPEPPPPPKPAPKPKPKAPEKPKELERIVTNVVAKVEQQQATKPEKEKAPEPPKKTAKELREERLRKMRESAKAVNKSVAIEVRSAPSGNGRTAKKTLSDAEIRRLLMMGYKPGTTEQLATSDLQLGYSLIKLAFEAKWDKPPWTDTLKPMTIRVWFGNGGRVVNFRLESSSGDARADQSIKSAASRVGSVPGLPAAFIEKYRSVGVPVRFTVRPE
ncbi:MAG: cell envelope integrity protein TolA [Kiritimatiellia bacterium]